MSRGVRSIVKTVAMIAVPFIAAVAAPILAPIALAAVPALGVFGGALTGLTGAALGAGLGGLTGAVTGRGALTGALMGGLGGGLGAASGLGTSIGQTVGGSAYTAAAGLPTQLPGAALGAAGTSGIAGAFAPSAGATATSLLTNLAGGITPSGLTNLAMTLYNKPDTELSATERAALMETAQLAQTNQDLFKKRVEDAVTLRNMATPNPEQAFAEAQMGVQRGLRETQRRYGGDTGAGARRGMFERQAAIEGVRAGTAAVRGEMARGFEQTRTAMAAMPTEAPGVTPGTVAMQFEDMQRKRQQAADEQTAKAAGGLFGRAPSTGSAGLFESIYSRQNEPTLRSLTA